MNILTFMNKQLRHPLFYVMICLFALCFLPAFAGEIGEQAKERINEVAAEPKEFSSDALSSLIGWAQKLGFLTFLVIGALLAMAARLVDFDPFKKLKANEWNAYGFALFGVVFALFVGYEVVEHGQHIVPRAASKHGAEIDTLFIITVAITSLVFVITQAALFYFVFKYRYRADKLKARWYPNNHKLELIWTVVPAIALCVLVLDGLIVWENVHHPDYEGKKPLEIELVGEQFQWRIRYPGADGKLGAHKFRLISGENPVGLDSADVASKDDFSPKVKEMHIPIGQPVLFKIRSKDVLHGVYAPHFRVNIYAVPGMPTHFAFTPTITTEQMRKEVGNPKFNYEMLCSQLCGNAHYNMRVVIVVDDDASYKKWLATQTGNDSMQNLTLQSDDKNNQKSDNI